MQNGRHFANDILKYIFLYENCCISNHISLKLDPKCRSRGSFKQQASSRESIIWTTNGLIY